MKENIISYKYNYDVKQTKGFYVSKSKLRFLIAWTFILLMFFGVYLIGVTGFFIYLITFFVWVVGIFVTLIVSGEKRLYITPRYLLCGEDVIYYHTITAIELYQANGTMIIHTPNIRLAIAKAKFPTGAQKQHKIEKNKNEKFFKVSDKIIKRVKAVNPNFMINMPLVNGHDTFGNNSANNHFSNSPTNTGSAHPTNTALGSHRQNNQHPHSRNQPSAFNDSPPLDFEGSASHSSSHTLSQSSPPPFHRPQQFQQPKQTLHSQPLSQLQQDQPIASPIQAQEIYDFGVDSPKLSASPHPTNQQKTNHQQTQPAVKAMNRSTTATNNRKQEPKGFDFNFDSDTDN